MSVTSGFFNSLNHDRRYSAQQMSAIFDGIINDGVFANIGVAFAVSAARDVTVNVGKGKAWFNSAWVYNDALLPLTFEASDVVLDRIDAVVIEIDHNESVRMGDIKIVKGTPSSSPVNPTLADETNRHQYPLAYIYRRARSNEIVQADITNMVGTSSCPYITGILQVQNIDNIVAQWNSQWSQWYSAKRAETDVDTAELLAEMKSEFDIWLNDVQALLDDDVATALAAQVAALQGKFDDLAQEGTIYDDIEDSNLGTILGSDGAPIQGRVVLSVGSVNSYSSDRSAYTLSLPESGWVGDQPPFTQRIVTPGMTASDTPHVMCILSDDIETALTQLEAWGMVCSGKTELNTIVFTCLEDKPNVPLTIQIEVIR